MVERYIPSWFIPSGKNKQIAGCSDIFPHPLTKSLENGFRDDVAEPCISVQASPAHNSSSGDTLFRSTEVRCSIALYCCIMPQIKFIIFIVYSYLAML